MKIILALLTAAALANAADAPLSALEQKAHERIAAKARVQLADQSADLFKGIDSLEPNSSGLVPNYVRAMTTLPKMAAPLSHLFKTFVSSSALPSETKLAMALRIAQINKSPYTVAHIERLLRATDRGKLVLAALQKNTLGALSNQERQAIAYADAMTRHVDGLSDTEFQATRAVYNDSQVVELSFTVCLFNYFTRFAEDLNLPVEPWVFETTPAPLAAAKPAPARIGLVSDEELKATAIAVAATKDAGSPTAAWNIGMANSQRAMLNAPEMFLAWRDFGAAARDYSNVSREIKLQVSFAVSTANGCRYCTLHQVLGLRRLGVDPAKLVAMQKDDASLKPEELAAVLFARKLTAEPAGTTDADYAKLTEIFKTQGALEVLMQTCNFAFMNRFTDGLRLPSEDEAVNIYHETYGADWQRSKK